MRYFLIGIQKEDKAGCVIDSRFELFESEKFPNPVEVKKDVLIQVYREHFNREWFMNLDKYRAISITEVSGADVAEIRENLNEQNRLF